MTDGAVQLDPLVHQDDRAMAATLQQVKIGHFASLESRGELWGWTVAGMYCMREK